MFPIAVSSTANDAKRLLFTSLAPTLYDYVGDPSLMQSLNHFLACSFSRIKPIELERDPEIDGPPSLQCPQGATIDTVLKSESMSIIPPFRNELGQLSCLSTTLKTLQDYQNVVSFFLTYGTSEKNDYLSAYISRSAEENYQLHFKYNLVKRKSRPIALKLFQMSQKQQGNLGRFPDCCFRIEMSLSYFKYGKYYSFPVGHLTYTRSNHRNDWSGAGWSSNTYSLGNQISIHQISEEQLMHDWLQEYMNIVQNNDHERIEDFFTEVKDEQLIPSHYQALTNLYEDLFRSNTNFDTIQGVEVCTVWIKQEMWQKYQQRYPLLKTIVTLTDYAWRIGENTTPRDYFDHDE